MYDDYERLVLEDYRRKKINMQLPPSLIFLTPAKLKSECERVCTERFHKKDEQVIRDFFGKSGDQKICLQAIQHCKPEKFKPLIKFLNSRTGKTDEKNIQLLAWLIDFHDRPFVFGKKYVSITETGIGVQESLTDNIVDTSSLTENPAIVNYEEENILTNDRVDAERSDASTHAKGDIVSTKDVVYDGQSQIDKGRKKMRFRKVAMVGVLLAVTGTSGYLWWNTTPQGNGGCMYWAKDHFQPIPCNQKVPNTLVVALDSVRVKNFKKITRSDTITSRAKGSVWYSKIDNEIEFFTTGGEHPVVIGRRLKPITDHIIDKYIHPGMTSNQ